MRGSLANIYRLGVKELRSLRSDPVLVVLILWAFTFLVYSVAKGEKFEVQQASIAIVDEDQSALSRRIGAAIQLPFFREPVPIAAGGIDKAMDRGQYVFVLEIPPRFEADILAGRRPAIQVDIDATAMSQAGNGAVFLQNIVSRELRSFIQKSDEGDLLPINLVVRTKFNPNAESVWFTSVMQIINNITMLSVILSGAALIREREHGTIEHLLVMPVTPIDIMLSKIWANGLVIVVSALLSFFLIVGWLLQVPIAGSVMLFVAGAVVYQFSVTALGILLATFTTSMQQFGLLVIPVLIAMNLLSGSRTPLESMPEVLQAIMRISPSTHFIGFAQAVLYRAADLTIVWPELVAMAAIGAVFFVVTLARFRKSVTTVQ
ncbi:MAG: ABC transporter permease [Rhizobiales bacterium]|nr:ABC transporter permease [Hyphomicrobiales bacterium]